MKKTGLALWTAALCCTALAGCGESRTASPYLKSTARAILVAKAYDRGDIAAREVNTAKLEASVAQLRNLGAASEALMLAMRLPPSEAEKEVDQGTSYYSLAERQTGNARANSQARAAAHYRKALQLQPDFTSPDPVKLNSLGYFLADHGTMASDFKLAEKLTRRSLQLTEELVKARSAQGLDTKPLLSFQSAVRDSVAWALYRQGRFAEALKEQQQAVKDTKDNGEKVSDELNQHLQLILKAARQETVANSLESQTKVSEPFPH